MKKQTIYEHFEDLRKTIIYIIVIFSIFFVFSFFYLSNIFINISSKILGISFVFLNPLEPILGKLNLSFWLSIFLPLPLYSTLVYKFLKPGLYKKEKKFAEKVLLAFFLSPIFFLVSYLISLNFFVVLKKFAFGKIIWGFESTISLLISLTIAFTLLFYTPFLIRALIISGLVEKEELKRKRKFIYVLAFIISAIITPTTDPITQTIVAFFIIFLFEISIIR